MTIFDNFRIKGTNSRAPSTRKIITSHESPEKERSSNSNVIKQSQAAILPI